MRFEVITLHLGKIMVDNLSEAVFEIAGSAFFRPPEMSKQFGTENEDIATTFL